MGDPNASRRKTGRSRLFLWDAKCNSSGYNALERIYASMSAFLSPWRGLTDVIL
jgi:hypothetical protein